MNPTSQPSRTEMIQRLADGELSDTERRDLLQTIDDETPERWRDVALGLLGNRLVAEGLRETASAPADNVIASPAWKRLGALAAALAIGLGIGVVVPQHRNSGRVADGGRKVTLFANMDDFKKAVGEAMVESDFGVGLQNLLAADSSGDRPIASAEVGRPRPFASHPEPEAVRPGPTPSVATAKAEGVENKVDEIQKSMADIRRMLQSMQNERK